MSALNFSRYFMPYQIEAIMSEARLVLWEKSIRIGATYAMAMRAVRRRMIPNAGNYLHTSVNERIAKSFIGDCKTFCRVFEAVANCKVRDSEIDEFSVYNDLLDIKESAFQIHIGATNQYIKVFSSNPDALRGEGGDVGIDELSRHKQPAELVKAAGGRAIWGYSVWIWTSHKGEDSEFNRMIKEERAAGEKSRWKIVSTDLYTAIDQGLIDKINATRGMNMTREQFIDDTIAMVGGMEAFEEECLLKPRKGGGSAIAWSLIDASRNSTTIIRYDLKGDETRLAKSDVVEALSHVIGDRRAWIGYDVARRGHLSSIPLLVEDGGKKVMAALVLIQDAKFGDQRAIIEGVMENRGQVSGLGDSTGLGMQVCEELEERFGESRFKGVNFSSLKPDLGTKLQRAFEDGDIVLPAGKEHDDIAYDIRAIRTESRPSGRAYFYESANPIEKRSHCDIAWGTALANMAAADDGGCGFDGGE